MEEDRRDRPANIQFRDESHEEEFTQAPDENELHYDPDEELAAQTPRTKQGQKGMPGWLKGVVALMAVVMVGGAGGIVYMKKRAAESDRIMTGGPVATQPTIAAGERPGDGGITPLSNVGSAPAMPVPTTTSAAGPFYTADSDMPVPVKPLALTQPTQQQAASNTAAPHAGSPFKDSEQKLAVAGDIQPLPASPAPAPPVTSSREKPAVTKAGFAYKDQPSGVATEARSQLDKGVIDAQAREIAGLKEAMTEIKRRLDAMESEAKTQNAKLAARPLPAVAAASESGTAPAQAAKPAPHPTKPVIARVQQVKAAPMVAARKVKPAPSPVQVASRDKPEAATTSNADRRDYRVTAIIGNRAFLSRKNADGSEVEQSVSPGDRLDGKLVTSVDAGGRQVVLEGGQRVTPGR